MVGCQLPGFDARTTFGALGTAIQIQMLLLGILTAQVYIYFSRFSRDPLIVKVVVGILYSIQVVNTISIIDVNYTWTIIYYEDPLALLQRIPLSAGIALFFGGLILPISQSFFGWRILVLSQKWYIASFIWLLALVRTSMLVLCTTVVLGAYTQSIPIFQLTQEWKWLVLFMLSFGWVADIITTACLCYYLNRERSHALWRTACILHKIMEHIIQTGLISGIVEITNMITFLKMPDNFIWMSIFVLIPIIFSNSLFASLNARVYLHGQHQCDLRKSMPSFQNSFRTSSAHVDITETASFDPEMGAKDSDRF